MRILVSVIVPAYNSQKCISKCLDSICAQKLKNIEIIVIDDGSIDKTKNICEKYAKVDNRIKVYSIKNSGVGHARNLGIEKAVGEYIAFVDSDDTIDESMYFEMYKNSDKKSDLIICGIECESLIRCINYSPINKQYNLNNNDTKEKILSELCFNSVIWNSPCNKLYKKSIIDKNLIRFPENIKRGEDLEFNRLFIPKCNVITTIDKPLYIYKLINESAMRSIVKNYKEIYLTYYNNTLEYISRNNLKYNKLKEELDINIFNAIKVDITYISDISISIDIKEAKSNIDRLLKDEEVTKILKDIRLSRIKAVEKALLYCLKSRRINIITIYGLIRARIINRLKDNIKKIIANIKIEGYKTA